MRRGALLILGTALAAASLSVASPQRLGLPTVSGSSASQIPACVWRKLDVELPATYHAAAVFDSVDQKLVYYGGLDANGSPKADVLAIDFSDPDIEQAKLVPAPIEGQQPVPRWGHSGVFRPTEGDPIIYWIAGQSGGRFEPTATPITPMPVRTKTPTPRPT